MHTFLEEYQTNIAPRIADIDVFLKTAEYPLDAYCVADLLDLDVREVLRHDGHVADARSFINIMQSGSSWICRMYQRELERESPPTYTSDDIAYIYNLDYDAVKNACKKLKIKEVTAFTMPLVFAKIPY
ncbi:MAG: hypothetical protein FWC67_05030 [Defluviitaleaceae bacterium]|nr:hypothetical protein [Defluviitaleaceae bacterium]